MTAILVPADHPVPAPPEDPVSEAAGPDVVDVAAIVRCAAGTVGRSWPLHAWVATNPLAGFEDRPFEEAVREAAAVLGGRTLPGLEHHRHLVAAGRVTEADLLHALVARGLLAVEDPRQPEAAALLADLAATDDVLPGRPAVTVAERLDAANGGRRAALVDDQAAHWCRLVLDHHAAWALPGRERGLWGAWRWHTARDRRLRAEDRALVAGLPAGAEDAVRALAVVLGIGDTEEALVPVATAHLTALPGWTDHLASGPVHPGAGDPLVDYLALRLGIERLVVGGERPPAGAPPRRLDADGDGDGDDVRARSRAALECSGIDAGPEALDRAEAALRRLRPGDRALVRLEAAEAAHRGRLLAALAPVEEAGRRPDPIERPAVQVACCIDPRSEGLRRHLEAHPGWETLGVAGFFGMPVSLRPAGSAVASQHCPVILTPAHEAVEAPGDGVRLPGPLVAGVDDAVHVAKEGVAAPLALAEVAGWTTGAAAAWRTLAGGRARRRPSRPAARIVLPGATPTERVELALGVLRSLGSSTLARLVVLCGHGAETANNPFAAGLDCGACGGHPGGDNARLAAALLNDPGVRAALAGRGFPVPDDTWFVAAQHDTTSDEVEVLDVDLVPTGHCADLAVARQGFEVAGRRLRAERAADLPGAGRHGRRRDGRLRRRGRDWAQAVPEWGLAGNAAMVIAPRSATAAVDLGRRAFLHSYDADLDPDGSVLAGILGGPLVVAHWISSQYFFSSVDPEVFGAGTKATHNVFGGTAVLAGPGGDLRRGLPRQSVRLGGRLVHEPLRLLAVVQAPLDRIDRVLADTPGVARLVDGGWVALAARSAATAPWSRRVDGGWVPWPAGPTRPAHPPHQEVHP